ncbi:MAG: hypothetical protein AB1813_22695 [Verrucomicrobiota bacterium]
MKRPYQILAKLWIPLLIILAAALIGWMALFDRRGKPACHKMLGLALKLWMQEEELEYEKGTNAFPNVNGSAVASLGLLAPVIGGDVVVRWTNQYGYVPGLRQNDPRHLVLFYFKVPTRYRWHQPIPPTRFQKRLWIIVPVDFAQSDRPILLRGEYSEAVTSAEFKQRLMVTMDFLRTQERAGWQNAVAEHSQFLKRLDDALSNKSN